jgi:hypothetical protein
MKDPSPWSLPLSRKGALRKQGEWWGTCVRHTGREPRKLHINLDQTQTMCTWHTAPHAATETVDSMPPQLWPHTREPLSTSLRSALCVAKDFSDSLSRQIVLLDSRQWKQSLRSSSPTLLAASILA